MTDPDRDRLPRVRAGVGAVIVIGLLGLGVAVLLSLLAPGGRSEVLAPDAGAPTSATNPATGSDGAAVVFVHILGAVNRPGLYELREGDRAVDAVAAAGGFTPDADQAALNLARLVADGEQLVIPVAGAAPPAGAPPPVADDRVNLNTADVAALETLPRVGPELAQRIVDWRDANGPFRSVDDLGQVSGIGDKTLDGLRDRVTV
ncbi:competence protein ComEA [Diaminobutyricimonas aerilata]|uniref:Competence protein ComEA n=1 Tax=Diaminobutyricimonas aerilata TaxID=1162967 RepID=A0A2M9CJC3_9MICO|nr:ComEA family DNA-binding protein [Diaminobutyricimonas aerilata]PJJ72003.1 competence protein ComEA [Diaminobutyricimonas aerilata]